MDVISGFNIFKNRA